MKVVKIFLLFSLFVAHPTLYAQSNVVDEVIWVVGGEPILRSDVEEARISLEMKGMFIEDPYCKIPEQLAVQKLFLHQADLDSIDADESYVSRLAEAEISNYIQAFGSRENVEAQARRTISQIRDMYKREARNQYRVDMVKRNLTSDVHATPAEVRDYFKHMPADSLPFVPTQVEVQIITAKPEVPRQEVERIEARLREFARRVNEGESEFSTLAKFYSQDGSARDGGELGLTGKGQWVPEFANVAFSLNDPQKVSKIVRTEFGFHILQLIEKRGDKVNVRHILLKPEIDDSEFEKKLVRLDSIANDIRNEKFTFEEAALALSDDKDTKSNRGLMFYSDPRERSRTSRIQMKQLPPEVAKEVENMQPGDISKSFMMTDHSGQTVCAIVKLKKRIEGHRANATEDYQLLKDVVLEKRKAEKISKWIVEKQKNTYVRINSDWRNCNFEYPNWIK